MCETAKSEHPPNRTVLEIFEFKYVRQINACRYGLHVGTMALDRQSLQMI